MPERRIDWMEMVRLKRTWGVSIAALLYRAHHLGRLEPAAYENAMKTMSRRGWRRQEPGSLGASEQPQLLATAVEALATVGFGIGDLAAEMRLSEATLREILGVAEAGVQRVPLEAR